MKQNLGTGDRIIRGVVVAPLLVVIAYLVGFGSVVGIIAMVLAVVMLGTAAIGFCPLYVPLHIHTNHRQGAGV